MSTAPNLAAIRQRVQAQLELLARRSLDLAEMVRAGELEFLDAIDIAHDAAVTIDLAGAIERAGLIEKGSITTGADVVQAVLAEAFASVPRRPAP